MCLISCLRSHEVMGTSKQLLDWLEFAWVSNQDGAGFSYVNVDDNNVENNTVNIIKGFTKYKNFERSFVSHREKHPKSLFMVHFRYASYGKVEVANCHPFYVWPNKLSLAHNGSISQMNAKKNDGVSDSNLLAKFLGKLPKRWYRNPTYGELINSFLGTSKVSLLDHTNYIHIYNFSGWLKEDNGNILFSNDYYKVKRFNTETSNDSTVKETTALVKLDKTCPVCGYKTHDGKLCYDCRDRIRRQNITVLYVLERGEYVPRFNGKCMCCGDDTNKITPLFLDTHMGHFYCKECNEMPIDVIEDNRCSECSIELISETERFHHMCYTCQDRQKMFDRARYSIDQYEGE